MSTSTRRKKRDRTIGTNAINSTVATAPTTNNATTFTFTQKIEKIEKISTPTPTHQKKRARTTGATTNNDTIQLQNLVTAQMNAMKNEFDVKLSQFTNIQRDQQYQLEILRDENKKLKTEYEAKINEMKNEFKKQLDDLKQKNSTDSRSGSSVVVYGNDELSNTEHSTVTREVQSLLSTSMNNNDVKNIKVTKELSLHNDFINDVLIFTSKSNEKMVATTSEDRSIKITRLSDNKLVKTIRNAPFHYTTSLAMTKINNNDVIASSGYFGMVNFWSIDTFEEVASFECFDRVLSLAAYELNGKYMLACGNFLGFGSIELWDVQSMKKVDTLKSRDSNVDELHTFKYQNKTYLLSGDRNGKLNLWCLDDVNNKLVKTLRSRGGDGIDSLVTFDLDNDLLIAAGVGEKVMLWKMNNLEPYHQFNLKNGCYIHCLKPFMSNERAMLASVSEGGWFHVFDVTEKKVLHEFKSEDHEFYSLDVCEEGGNYMFIAGGENIKTKKGSMVFLK